MNVWNFFLSVIIYTYSYSINWNIFFFFFFWLPIIGVNWFFLLFLSTGYTLFLSFFFILVWKWMKILKVKQKCTGIQMENCFFYSQNYNWNIWFHPNFFLNFFFSARWYGSTNICRNVSRCIVCISRCINNSITCAGNCIKFHNVLFTYTSKRKTSKTTTSCG